MKLNLSNFDVHGTLEFLHTADLDVQVRLFSILSTYVTLKDADTEVVITCNHIYAKLTNVLAKSTSRKAAIGLNFISALLHVDEERCKNLALYAKNMIRTSGCLSTMCDLFTSCIVCIQRCNQNNVETFVVLTSLLQNNKRNTQLFIDNNGESLFTRELLQYEACLQLLATLVQSSSQATALIAKSNISHDLRDFLQRYGPQSRLGQWATVILYHISRLKEFSPKLIDSPSESLKRIIQNQVKMVPKEGEDDTALLFQNVVKEILHWEPKKHRNNLQTFIPRDTSPNWDEKVNLAPNRASNKNTDRITSITRNKTGTPKYFETKMTSVNGHLKPQVANEYSFSFLRRQNFQDNCDLGASEKQSQVMNTLINATTQTDTHRMLSSDFYEINRGTHENHHELAANFKPMFVSTPKRNSNESLSHQTKLSNSNIARRSTQIPIKPPKQRQRVEIKKRIAKKKNNQDQELSKLDKEIKNRSISARFFGAVNESCTNLVKTVKSIFVSKNLSGNRDVMHSKEAEKAPPCNYSFTNYMRKRDAVLLNEASKIYSKSDVLSSEITNSCNTCNNTVVLKRKLANDDYLKNTIKKLKVGINLYGCNFKKISRTLWPQETYMTPVVLYNLYRKLIIK